MEEVHWGPFPGAEGLATGWVTTGTFFLKGARLPVPHDPPPAHRRLHMADTGIEATKGTDAGETSPPFQFNT